MIESFCRTVDGRDGIGLDLDDVGGAMRRWFRSATAQRETKCDEEYPTNFAAGPWIVDLHEANLTIRGTRLNPNQAPGSRVCLQKIRFHRVKRIQLRLTSSHSLETGTLMSYRSYSNLSTTCASGIRCSMQNAI